jgi:serine/threonine protein kinase/protein-tyrosine phosphatase
LSSYVLGIRLGGGAFGQVFAATHKDIPDAQFAIKFVLESTYDAEDQVLRNLNHPNIVPCIDSFLVNDVPDIVLLGAGKGKLTGSRSRYCYVLPLCTLGDLTDMAGRCEGGKLGPERIVWRVLLHLARGLDYLHDNNIIHSDIKPQNVLCSQGEGFMLSDFGTARTAPGVIRLETITGTVSFMPSESAYAPFTASAAADMWSLGATLWSLLTGNSSFVFPSWASRDAARALVKSAAEKERVRIAAMKPQEVSNELTKLKIPHSTHSEIVDAVTCRLDLDKTLVDALFKDVPSSGTSTAEARAAILPEILAVARAGASWIPPPLSDSTSLELRNLVSSMLSWDPAARPTPQDILLHPKVQEASALLQALDSPAVPTTANAVKRAQDVAHVLTLSGTKTLSHVELNNLIAAFKGIAPFGARNSTQIVPPGLISRRQFCLILQATELTGLLSEDLICILEVGHYNFVSWKDLVAGMATLAKQSGGDRDEHLRVGFKAFDVSGPEHSLNRFEIEELLAVFNVGAPTLGMGIESEGSTSSFLPSFPLRASSSGAGASDDTQNRNSNNALIQELFKNFDADGNGVVSKEEFDAALANTKSCLICRLDVNKRDYGMHVNDCRARIYREQAGALHIEPAVAALFEPTSHLGGKRVDTVLIPLPSDNAVQVFPRIFLGNQWAATGGSFLRSNKVRGIVNVAEREAPILPQEQRDALGILEVRSEDILDVSDMDYTRQISHASDHIRDVLAALESDGSSVLVHCVQGISRSPTVVIAYLIRHGGLTLLEAATLVRQKRWQAMPNIAFWRSLRLIEIEAKGVSTITEDALKLHWSVVVDGRKSDHME